MTATWNLLPADVAIRVAFRRALACPTVPVERAESAIHHLVRIAKRVADTDADEDLRRGIWNRAAITAGVLLGPQLEENRRRRLANVCESLVEACIGGAALRWRIDGASVQPWNLFALAVLADIGARIQPRTLSEWIAERTADSTDDEYNLACGQSLEFWRTRGDVSDEERREEAARILRRLASTRTVSYHWRRCDPDLSPLRACAHDLDLRPLLSSAGLAPR